MVSRRRRRGSPKNSRAGAFGEAIQAISASQIIRWVAVVIGGSLLIWLSILVTIAGITRDRSPSTALKYWPRDGYAMANKADLLLGPEATRDDLLMARNLAIEALRNEPTSAKALRVKAFADEIAGKKEEAKRAILLGGQLSRRDLFTNVWLIEEAVARGDVPGALRYYDIALRTSRSAPGLLFPVLDGALGDPSLEKPIANLLSSQQPWVPEFVEYVVREGKQQGPLTKALLAAPKSLDILPTNLKAALLFKLVDLKQFDLSGQLYAKLQPGSSAIPHAGIRDPGFERESLWPPLDWALTVAPEFGATVSPRDKALSFFGSDGAGGIVARQLIAAAPGRYRFSSSGSFQSQAPRGSARWNVLCAGTPETALMSVDLPNGDTAREVAADLVVPAGCRWQWIQLDINTGDDQSALNGAVDWVRLARN